MTTLLAVYDSRRCVGRCDAQCYLAATARCSCICGGRNHGVGLERAMENVAAGVGLRADDVERFAVLRDLRCDELVSIDRRLLPDSRAARAVAYMKLFQPELPFDGHADL